MEKAVEVFAVVHFLTIGLSHIFQPRVWARFFILLREKGNPGVFFVAYLSLGFGSIVVSFHNVWSGLPVALTVMGWAQVLKGLVYFVAPGVGLRKLGWVTEERAGKFVLPGVAFVALALLLVYQLVFVDPGAW